MSVTIRRESQSDVAAFDAQIVSAFLYASHTSHHRAPHRERLTRNQIIICVARG